MYASVSTSPVAQSCITQGTSPRSSKRTASSGSVPVICRSLRSGIRGARNESPGSDRDLGHDLVLRAGVLRLPGPRLLDPDAVQQALIAAPAAPHLDLEVEEDACAEVSLELLAGRGAHLADHPAALADENPLLGLGLHPDLGAYLHQAVVPGLDVVDDHLDGVRHLVAGPTQDLLPDQLGEVD